MLVPYTITLLRNIYGWSPWHQQCPALTSCGDLLRHSGHRQDDCNCGVFAISCHTKLFLGLCNINEWWIGRHRSHTLDRFGHNFLCRVTNSPISPQGRPRFKLSYRGNLQQPVELKIVRTKIITYRTPIPLVELARWKQTSIPHLALVFVYHWDVATVDMTLDVP